MWWIFFTKTIFLVFCLSSGQPTAKTTFSCDGRPSGYYADVSTGCQVYHMCDGIGRQFSYTCPNATLFQQRMLICDHWYMVNCTRAEADYGANLLIGQKKPFVDDSEYYRTPRPDLLSAPRNENEANIIYRTGRKQISSHVVGIETKIGDLSAQNEATYFPPSHWSTNNGLESVTTPSIEINFDDHRSDDSNRREGAKAINSNSFLNRNGNNFENRKTNSKFNSKGVPPLIRNKPDTGNVQSHVVFGSNFKATTPVYPMSVESTSVEPSTAGVLPPVGRKPVSNIVNFQSNFKATTPVYPTSVEPSSPEPNNIGLLPPQNDDNNTSKIKVNFESNFKATTPVYPLSVESTSPNPDNLGLLPPKGSFTEDSKFYVNFQSSFRATTPVYPLSVESTSPNPDNLGLLPPKGSTTQEAKVHVNYESNFKATTPVYPSTVDPTSPNPNEIGLVAPGENSSLYIHFESNFKATTPVYPKSVESTSIDPSVAGLLAPQENDDKTQRSNIISDSDFKATTPVFPTSLEDEIQDSGILSSQNSKNDPNVPSVLLEILPPKFDESYKLNRDPNIETTVLPPSKFYQAPKFDPDFTISEVETNDQLGIRINNFMKSLSGSQWHNLREQFKIPEYEFPLEENGRPNYEGTLNSFDAKPVKKKK